MVKIVEKQGQFMANAFLMLFVSILSWLKAKRCSILIKHLAFSFLWKKKHDRVKRQGGKNQQLLKGFHKQEWVIFSARSGPVRYSMSSVSLLMPDRAQSTSLAVFSGVVFVCAGERLKGSETELADAVGAVAVEEADSDWARVLEQMSRKSLKRSVALKFSLWHEPGCWASEFMSGQVRSWLCERVWACERHWCTKICIRYLNPEIEKRFPFFHTLIKSIFFCISYSCSIFPSWY